LFTSVAEFVVTSGPIDQRGCASACAGVTPASADLGQPRNGPPVAVITSRRTSSRRPPRSACASAECSESTGTICPGRAARFTSGPPTISDSLLASASVRPAVSAASVAGRPSAPSSPLSTTSHGCRAISATPSGPASSDTDRSSASRNAPTASGRPTATTSGRNSATCEASSAGSRPPAASPTTRNRSGLRRTTSSAWVPIDPVDPSTTTERAGMPPTVAAARYAASIVFSTTV
jgi:hypothetical protein